MLNRPLVGLISLALAIGGSPATVEQHYVELSYHGWASSCVPPFENSNIGTTKIGTRVCIDGQLAAPISGNDAADSVPDQSGSLSGPADSGPPPDTICEWYTLDDSSTSVSWGTNSPADGHLEGLKCYPRVLDTSREGTGGGSVLVDSRFVPNAAPAQPVAPPPPDPAVLAEQAYGELEIPAPSIGAGPGRDELAVNLWTWLWIDNPGPMANTVAAGGVSVTATAILSSVTWSLGEPATLEGEYSSGPPAMVTCQGSGSPPPANYDWKAQPPCGYMWHWRSLKERTGGTGKWPITATSTWDVTWQANTGATGATTLTATSADQFDIGEFRTVLVQGPGG